MTDRAKLSVSRAAVAHPDAPALVFDERALTWSNLAERVRRRGSDQASAEGPLDLVVRRDESSLVDIYAAIEAGRPILPWSPHETPARRSALLGLVRQDETHPRPLAYVSTSGSSGSPRAAVLSRHAFAQSARASATRLPFGPGDRWLLSMPLFHVGGLSILTRALWGGGAVVVAPEGPFGAEATVHRIERARVTHASFVPTMLSRVVAGRLVPPPSVRAVLVGGGPVAPDLLTRARALGWPVLPTYGLTEACSQVATRLEGDTEDRLGRVGPPLPGVEVRIAAGEIQLRGPTLASGYVGAASPFTPDGWLSTGDLGSVGPDGALTVRGRRDDMIITGGENVHPTEVEALVCEHPAVGEACVFGLPHPEWGEVVAAAVVTTLAPEELDAWLGDNLPSQRRPRRVFVVESLVKRESGKVDRAGTRQRALGS